MEISEAETSEQKEIAALRAAMCELFEARQPSSRGVAIATMTLLLAEIMVQTTAERYGYDRKAIDFLKKRSLGIGQVLKKTTIEMLLSPSI